MQHLNPTQYGTLPVIVSPAGCKKYYHDTYQPLKKKEMKKYRIEYTIEVTASCEVEISDEELNLIDYKSHLISHNSDNEIGKALYEKIMDTFEGNAIEDFGKRALDNPIDIIYYEPTEEKLLPSKANSVNWGND